MLLGTQGNALGAGRADSATYSLWPLSTSWGDCDKPFTQAATAAPWALQGSCSCLRSGNTD